MPSGQREFALLRDLRALTRRSSACRMILTTPRRMRIGSRCPAAEHLLALEASETILASKQLHVKDPCSE